MCKYTFFILKNIAILSFLSIYAVHILLKMMNCWGRLEI